MDVKEVIVRQSTEQHSGVLYGGKRRVYNEWEEMLGASVGRLIGKWEMF